MNVGHAAGAAWDRRTFGAQNTLLKTRHLARTRLPRVTEKALAVVMLFCTTGAVLPLLDTGLDPMSAQIRPREFAVMAALYTLTLFFIAVRWRSFVQGVWNAKWIMALVVIAIVSTVWSQNPALTLRRSAVLLATTAFGVYFGTRYTVAQQLRLLASASSLVVALSFFFAMFLPKYGIDQNMDGAWQGVFVQKNGLARFMVLAVFAYLFVRPKLFRSLRWLGVAASLTLLLLSRSATGMIVCVGTIAILALYRLVGARNAIALPFVVAGLLVVGVSLSRNFTLAGALQAVGRTPDLTGRTELWDAVLHSVAMRPCLGYGFSAFWQGSQAASDPVRLATGWLVVQSHNGFLDLLLSLGWVGAITFVLGYLILWRRALLFELRAPGPVPMWLCTYLILILLYNLTESSILEQNNVQWVLYASTAANLFPVFPRRR